MKRFLKSDQLHLQTSEHCYLGWALEPQTEAVEEQDDAVTTAQSKCSIQDGVVQSSQDIDC